MKKYNILGALVFIISTIAFGLETVIKASYYITKYDNGQMTHNFYLALAYISLSIIVASFPMIFNMMALILTFMCSDKNKEESSILHNASVNMSIIAISFNVLNLVIELISLIRARSIHSTIINWEYVAEFMLGYHLVTIFIILGQALISRSKHLRIEQKGENSDGQQA